MDIQRNDAIDGAQSMIIVGTLLLTKNMERTAQGAPKVLDIKNITLPRFPFANLSYFKNFELILLHKVFGSQQSNAFRVIQIILFLKFELI